MKITLDRDIQQIDRRGASDNRNLFTQHQVLALNLMSSPGAGKTTLLERMIADLKSKLTIGVIEGDIQTSLDAERIERAGAAYVHQINTYGACHINAEMVTKALPDFSSSNLDILVIENVGNLVCPAEFDLGEDHKVVLYSITEGEEKPQKYPLMFHESSILLINKIDLLPHLDIKLEKLHRHALAVHPGLRIFDVSAKTGIGLDDFYGWVLGELKQKKPDPSSSPETWTPA